MALFAQRAGDFLLHLGHADGAFAKVVGERHRRIGYEQQHRVSVPAQMQQQVEGDGLLDAASLATGLKPASCQYGAQQSWISTPRRCGTQAMAIVSAVACRAKHASSTQASSVAGEMTMPCSSLISCSARERQPRAADGFRSGLARPSA